MEETECSNGPSKFGNDLIDRANAFLRIHRLIDPTMTPEQVVGEVERIVAALPVTEDGCRVVPRMAIYCPNPDTGRNPQMSPNGVSASVTGDPKFISDLPYWSKGKWPDPDKGHPYFAHKANALQYLADAAKAKADSTAQTAAAAREGE